MKLVGLLTLLVLLGVGTLLTGCRAATGKAMPGPTAVTPAPAAAAPVPAAAVPAADLKYLPQDG